MTLEELGFEYLDELRQIEKCIGNTKQRLKTARGAEHVRLLHDLDTLRKMRRECEDTAYHLIHYYKPCKLDKKSMKKAV